jgi:CRISPR type IV-associated protein Csf3
MFKNFKAIAYMRTPIAAIDPIILDSIISAAKAKELLGEDFYTGENVAGTKEEIESMLNPILDKQDGVYCTSIGLGDNREYVGSWSKRWDDKNDDIVEFRGRGKKRIDIGAGYYKNYHMPLVLKSYKTITFYVRGDMGEIERLLNNYIFYLGKKGSQGYGQIRKWEFEEIEENWSVWKDNKPMRPIPVEHCEEYIDAQMKAGEPINARQHPILPPYWRKETELCLMPEGM